MWVPVFYDAASKERLLKKLEAFWQKVKMIRQISEKCIAIMHIKMRQNVNIPIDFLPCIVYNEHSIL